MAIRSLALLGIMIGAMAGAGAAHAGPDEGLYDPLPPEGSAFVRFINAKPDASESLKPSLDGKSYDDLDFSEVSSYYVKPAAESVKVAFEGAGETTGKLEEGKFYTAVLRGSGVEIIEDAATENRTKALVLFYNLTDKNALGLKTADGKTAIVPDVKSGDVGSREMNAVRIGFSVAEGDSAVAKVDEQALQRGSAYAVIAMTGKDGAPQALFVPSRTDTTK